MPDSLGKKDDSRQVMARVHQRIFTEKCYNKLFFVIYFCVLCKKPSHFLNEVFQIFKLSSAIAPAFSSFF